MSTPQRTILIVDDEPALREAMVFDFEMRGFTVVEAENGQKALEALEKNHIDIILTDVRMPVMGGLELLDQVRAQSVQKPVVMFITGYTDITAEEAYDRGADAVFSKPFQRKALFESVERALQDPQTRWSETTTPPETAAAKKELAIHGQFESLKQAEDAGELHVGRGGFFISSKQCGKTSGFEFIRFELQFEAEPNQTLVGTGRPLWSRSEVAGATLPAGTGVEILSLEEPGRTSLVNRLSRTGPKAYIPRK